MYVSHIHVWLCYITTLGKSITPLLSSQMISLLFFYNDGFRLWHITTKVDIPLKKEAKPMVYSTSTQIRFSTGFWFVNSELSISNPGY